MSSGGASTWDPEQYNRFAGEREQPFWDLRALLAPVGRLVVLRVFPREQFLPVMSFIAIPGLVGPLIGPTLGGFLVQYVSWHWIFLINLPVIKFIGGEPMNPATNLFLG